MRRLALCLLPLLLTVGTHAQVPQQQLSNTLQILARTRQDEAGLRKKLAASEQDMQRLRERSAQMAERLQINERRVSAEENALAEVSAEYAKKRNAFEARKADYSATILSLLRLRNLPQTVIFSSPDDTRQLLRTASVLEKTNAALAAKTTRLRNDMAQITRLQRDAATRDKRTRAEESLLKKAQNNLARELAARQKLQSRLNADYVRTAERVETLSRESQSLQELIGKLAEEEKKHPPAAKAASLRSFSGRKGSMRTPVNGEIIHRFGERKNANETYRGIVFRARSGAAVVAPYDGKIAFTGPFRDYGNMVLIKHDNGYISLISGLGHISVSLNQAAIRGEPIGSMPESSDVQAYVELRGSDAKPIDPANWFANVVGKSAHR